MNLCADTFIRTLQTPAVRDLAWSCFSPPLIISDTVAPAGLQVANCGLILDDRRMSWLLQLDQDPRPLVRQLERLRSRRLGLYFEALWHFFLQSDERTELLAHNLPVRDHGTTIGEFDCLYFCRERQRHFHLELAVKFYLGLPADGASTEPSRWDCWLGPDSRDRLDIKLDRLLQHQIRLANHPRSRDILHDMGIEQLELEMEIKGRLFSPGAREMAPPHGCNREGSMGRWERWEDTAGRTDLAVLDKQHWLAPVTPASGLTAGIPPTPAAGPRLVAVLDSRGNERERLFLVPDRWPGDS